MAISGLNQTVSKSCSINKDNSSEDFYTSSGVVFRVTDNTYGNSSITYRSKITVKRTSSTTFSVIGPEIQAIRSGTCPTSDYLKLLAMSASMSGFKSVDTSSSYPLGQTITSLNSKLPAGTFTTIAARSSGSGSVIDASNGAVNATIDSTMWTYWNAGDQAKSLFKISWTISVPSREKLTITYKNGSTNFKIEYAYYKDSYRIISTYPNKSPYTDTDSGSYTLSYNTDGGTSIQSVLKNWSWKEQINYSFDSWGGYPLGFTINGITNSMTLDARFNENGQGKNWTYSTIGNLPTAYKKGYFKTNVWYYSDNSPVSSSDQVKGNTTIKCKWDPQTYQIKYNLNGGQMPEDMGKISDYISDKTYSVNSARTPNFTPLRLGYRFIGWSDQTKSITPIGVNAYIPDTFYNAVNTEYTNNNVTLYAQWEYNVNTVKCVYYLTDSGSEQVDTHTYNIDTATLDPQGDKAFLKYAPNQLRSGDFVFLGWLDAKPDGWDTQSLVNNGYHGTYTVPPEKVVDTQGHEIEIELPIDIKIKNYKDLNDWGIIETYYGIWAKTGKYMKINGSWKKVNKCFVKINGVWKTVVEMWTKQNGSWKHEI